MAFSTRGKDATAAACKACVDRCRTVAIAAQRPGLLWPGECKQVARFSKTIAAIFEELCDEGACRDAAQAGLQTAANAVVTSMDRAVRVLDACAKHGKLQAAADAAQVAASFTNVAIELHTALRAFADQNMISDAMLEKQLDVTLTELAKLQQPEYGASAQTMARLRACCEQMRVDELSHSTSHDLRGRETPPVDLQSALLEIVDGSRAEQLASDVAYAEQQHAAATHGHDAVSAWFWGTLAAALQTHLPSGMPASTVISIRPPEEQPVPDPSKEFVAGLVSTVDQLRDALEPVDVENRHSPGDDCAPRKSKQLCEQLAHGKRADTLAAIAELLAVTEDMPVVSMPLCQADIVQRLACTDAVASLVSCVTASEYETRLQALELLERLVVVDKGLVDNVVAANGVRQCIAAIAMPELPIKPRAIALKSGAASIAGIDTFTPTLRAVRLLKQLCTHSEPAQAQLARVPPKPVAKKKSAASTQPTRQSVRASRLSEKLRASQSNMEAPEDHFADVAVAADSGGLSSVIQLVAKVKMYDAGGPAPPREGLAPNRVASSGRYTVVKKTEAELEKLRADTPEAAVAVKVMTAAAEVLEALASSAHSAVLVAQGGLLAVAEALRWDVHADVNTPCATIVYRLAKQRQEYLQMAVDAGCCDSLAQLTASADFEEQAAASKAVAVLLAGVSATHAPALRLGFKAAAAGAHSSAAAVMGTAVDAKAAEAKGRFCPGGGLPTASLFPLLQLIAMSGVQDAPVDLRAAMHALAVATETSAARIEVIAIEKELRNEGATVSALASIAVLSATPSAAGQADALQLLRNMGLEVSYKPSLVGLYKPLLSGANDEEVRTGGLRCLAALLPPAAAAHEHLEATRQMCKELATLMPDVVLLATASRGEALDLAAIDLLATFGCFATDGHLAGIARQDTSSAACSIGSRLVSMAAADSPSSSSAISLLQQIVHRLPKLAQDLLQGLLGVLDGTETQEEALRAIRALVGIMQRPASLTTCDARLRELIAGCLGGAGKLLRTAVPACGCLASESVALLYELCRACVPAQQALLACTVLVMTPDATGQPQQLSGLAALAQALRSPGGTEVSRAYAAAVLGEVALRSEPHITRRTLEDEQSEVPQLSQNAVPATIRAVHSGDCSADDAVDDEAQAMRCRLFEQGLLEPMFHALWDISALLVDATRSAVERTAPQRFASRASRLTDKQSERSSVVRALTADELQQVRAAQEAAVRAVINMSFGRPHACVREAHCALLHALKSGSPAKKLAAAQVLRHALAPVSARMELHKQQVIPALVSVCSTGLPSARAAAAESLINLASTPGSRAGSPATPEPKAPRDLGDADMRVEVQRAGALPALTAMLAMPDERCVQAAATALYVLADNEENRRIMAGAGVRVALQAVLAKAKTRPAQICDRTRRDCEEAMARVIV